MLTERKRNGWLACYAFMLAFALVMVPHVALADTYVGDGDDSVAVAMRYLGYDPNETPEGGPAGQNKLVSAFISAYDGTSPYEGYTGWQGFVRTMYQPAGITQYNDQWWSTADGFMFSDRVDKARADAANIYSQWARLHTSSGGSGGGATGETLELEFTPNVPTYAYLAGLNNTKIKNYADYSSSGSTLITSVTVTVGPNVADKLRELVAEDKQVYAFFWPNYNSLSKTSVMFVIADSFTETVQTVDGHSAITNLSGTNLIYWNTSSSNYNPYFIISANNITIDGDHIDAVYTTDVVRTINSVSDGNYNTSNVMYITRVELGGSTPDPEPEEPTAPEPTTPPVDEPDTPTTPPVDPTPPTPDPTTPSQTIDLQGIIDRLDIIIRNQVVLINWLDDAFASVNANVVWLGETLHADIGWLGEYITSTLRWMYDNLRADIQWLTGRVEALQGSIVSGFTRVTTWLEMIYNRIGGQGGPATRPNIDTPTPWDDFLSWLEGILQRLLDLLFGVTPAALQGLLSGLADLTGKFPFSIPWDLAALVALFAHAPITPVIDFPLMVPFMDAPLLLHVDCTQWDGLAAICRDGETVIFSAWLVLRTPDLYRHLNNVSGAD